ncbi:MAG: suppressor of hpr1 [Alectoria fallacina]|uniref:Mediator of RNA polymerase II transcription subunit 31 n=1 Tax=Alectoria fallacina TaxID=1903189 RepID=A0A8H3PKZ7_9LECA|nr:MAG: suppressor of hpr1 [Alectoria fallacina]
MASPTTATAPAILPVTQSSPPPPPPITLEPLYAGHTRFELELEFVSMLSSPLYLNHLAALKLLQAPDFVAYLKYLQYWTRPEYITFLSYPGPTIRALELLQEERFRREVLSPEVVGKLMQEGVRGSLEFQGR